MNQKSRFRYFGKEAGDGGGSIFGQRGGGGSKNDRLPIPAKKCKSDIKLFVS